MPETKYSKRVLNSGLGNLYTRFMETEDTETTPPEYSAEIYETPSLQDATLTMEVAEKTIRLSNKVHDKITYIQSIELVLNAGYFAEGVAEKAQGMVNIGGGWSMPTNPVAVPMSISLDITNMNGDSYVVHVPKALLSPVDISGETEGDDINENIQQYTLTGYALAYKGDQPKAMLVHTLDMGDEKNKEKYDVRKLLTQGWFDESTLALCEKTAVLP